jgi:uncharacterized SAM-binding protein YcdF (DUF218 family)
MTYIQPFFALLVFLGLGACLFSWTELRKGSTKLLMVVTLGVFLLSWPLAWVLVHMLEARYPPREVSPTGAQAIVVLSSAVYPPTPAIPTPRLGNDTYERCLYSAWLFKKWRTLPILTSGGTIVTEKTSYSMEMREALVSEGIPESMIWSEEQSHSTHENALYSAQLLKNEGISRIVLVTDAYHMDRAYRCFRKQGLEVIPAARGYRSYGSSLHRLVQFLPNWEPIGWNEDSPHEYVGLAWYWLHDWI